MNNNGSAKGWLSCVMILLVSGLVLTLMFKFLWIVLPVIFLLNLIRGWLWRRRIKKAEQQVNDFMKEKKKGQEQNYCEAEFEILQDDSEN